MDQIEQGYAAPTIAQQHSDALLAHIKAVIAEQGGWIDFAHYMQLCLYTPGLGYYANGNHKIGEGGDFTTAPEISPLFGQSIAQHIYDVAAQMKQFDILEFGAGSGKLTNDILTQLSQKDCLPRHYYILEVSAELRDRQQAYLRAHCPDLISRIHWLDRLPSSFEGIMLANEVCDAMPAHRIRLTEDRCFEQGISVEKELLNWFEKPLNNDVLRPYIERIRALARPNNYITEINLFSTEWVQTLAHHLKQGALFVIDYGYSAAQYYSEERQNGTLRCYYQQQATEDPLIRPGLQDITTHVNFSALAESALASGLTVSSYQEQGDFLLAGGITELAENLQTNIEEGHWLAHSAALKQLLMPNGMGLQFKVLSLTKELDVLPRLSLADRRYQLYKRRP